MTAAVPTRAQYRVTRAVVRWYLGAYFGTPHDVGVAAMFCEAEKVGHFAVSRDALTAGDPKALFRLLVAMTMFQRRQDAQIMRVLQGINKRDAYELTSPPRLLKLADSSSCGHLRSNEALLSSCDLYKDAETKLGGCYTYPEAECHLKRHTVLLKRYGHFGKVPTSAALMVRESGARDLSALHADIVRQHQRPDERARALELALSRAWRVSEKISAMFLSALTNADLSGALAPWAEGIDGSHFVVIDSNVDLFLTAVGYPGPWTYGGRRNFVQALAKRMRLDEMRPGLSRYNPRLVQQALYLFMSETNRRAADIDCSHLGVDACDVCPSVLRGVCSRRATE